MDSVDAAAEEAAPASRRKGRAVCRVCPHACAPAEGARGICRARVARGGEVACENYGRVTSLALDPVEKKPLARWRPGTLVLSAGSYGCNLRCPFCQNAEIACAGEDDVSWRALEPAELVALATEARPRGCVGIAYTYNEPFVGFEFVRDTARLAREAGLANVVVSNGMINPGPLAEVLPFIDAANIDLKGFTREFYDLVGGDLDTVKATIAALVACPTCHVEVTTLVVPSLNDDPAEIDAAASWLASLDPFVPYHLTRFFPCHRMADRAPTPVPALRELAAVARRHLNDVLLGNC
ncbi:AmmeMemoRadiSam system radical SAM enzyme [Gordonibacter sp. 28C]|uniref:AmmeMemoRadiSam system radical SAM enzyme n=1 Tax=Gordonibacter sp. 28C TaxID=2078569 RepID=UPI000DF767EE|nr:AmmeMemoRadiSam system radical SAM enzyme [Gordonibacter sp. 28C]RDB62289.1 AmmeMemoRadiSam system radical SAM enzyme [Gordonibacter sp. 28C]